MAISEKDVRHVASLANLQLDEAEVQRLTTELGHILGHIDQLRALDTAGVPPTRHVALAQMPLRQDVRRPSLDPRTALESGPRCVDGGFAVPAFVDD